MNTEIFMGFEVGVSREFAYLLFFALGYAIGVVIHEIGHVVAACFARLKVLHVRYGNGPLIFRWKHGGLCLDIRGLPFSGYVRILPLFDYEKKRFAIFILGGAFANLILLLSILSIEFVSAVPVGGPIFSSQIKFAQIFLIAYTLAPFRIGSYVPDGLQLAQLFRAAPGSPTGSRAAYDFHIAPYRRKNGYSSITGPLSRHIAHYFLTPYRSEDKSARDYVHEGLKTLLGQKGLLPEEQMLILDALVTDGLMIRGCFTHEELDTFSKCALALWPDNPTLIGSRASVLVELERYEEAYKMLSSIFDPEAKSYDAFMIATYLALSKHALGDPSTAREHLAFAESLAASLSELQNDGTIAAKLAEVRDALSDRSQQPSG